MNNGLISRKALLTELSKWDITKMYFPADFKELVKKQPIAYDLDKVCEELLKESYDDGHGFSIMLDKAEEIVKKGGCDE